MAKYFTVEEANRTLPLVRRIVGDIVATHDVIRRGLEEARSLDPAVAAQLSRRRELEAELSQLSDQVHGFIGELEEIGALFKGFEEGLIDFYGKLDGRPVFLCWRLGEENVEWWHELDAGYIGRQRLPAHLLSLGGS
jgi:hypothetical protein